jgi:hypothetical protein
MSFFARVINEEVKYETSSTSENVDAFDNTKSTSNVLTLSEECSQDMTNHEELNVMRKASKFVRREFSTTSSLYVDHTIHNPNLNQLLFW